MKDLEFFIVINSELYFRGTGGVLARAFSMAETKKNLSASIIFLVEIRHQPLQAFVEAGVLLA